MTESTGAIKFIVRYGSTPLAGAKCYTSQNQITWWFKGTTDSIGVLMALGVPSGLEYWMVSATGYNIARGSTNVPAGGGVQLDVYMTRSLSMASATGSLSVISNPAGACVYINEVIQENPTPVTIADLPSGDYVLRFFKDGYEDLITPVTIISGQTAEISVNLTSK